MGNSVAGKKKFPDVPHNKCIGFNTIHDDLITISEDGLTARWGLANINTDGEGRCYSNRTLRVNEEVRMSVRGSGFFDFGITTVHPGQHQKNKDAVFQFIANKVLFFEPVELRLRIGLDGAVYFWDGRYRHVKLRIGAHAPSNWLVMKLGCGQVTVTFLGEQRHDRRRERTVALDPDLYAV